MKNFKFDTLLLEKDLSYGKRWSPSSVSSYSDLIKRGILEDMNDALCRNICYSLQYLEYIDFQLNELKLHNIVEKLLCKTFIITSISIIEAIFYYILKNNNEHKTVKEKLLLTTRSNKKKFDGEDVIVETNLFKCIEPEECEMSFDTMIKKMEKGKYLNLKHKFFPYLKKFKDLRNRVHIHITDNKKDETDFFKFGRCDYLFIKHMLLSLLTDEKIQNTIPEDKTTRKIIPKEYHFLVLTKEEIEYVLKRYNTQKNKEE